MQLTSDKISAYISNVNMMSVSTAHEYRIRLNSFRIFVENTYKITVNILIEQIKQGSRNAYDILSQYGGYLKTSNNISNLTLKQRIVTVKNFLEYHDVDISPRKFRLKVKLPKIVRRNKEALSKEDVVDILNTCSDIRLKTYIMLLAATGMRAVEALSIRIKDLELQSYPPRLFVRGEFTKTRSDRTVFLTKEVAHQLSSWLDYKYRSRRVCYVGNNGKTVTEYRTPEKNEAALIFSVYQSVENPNPNNLYIELSHFFGKTLDRMGKGAREEYNKKRRQITLHSFRRFVKTTISDLGTKISLNILLDIQVQRIGQRRNQKKERYFKKLNRI